jgi:hypothetical protein
MSNNRNKTLNFLLAVLVFILLAILLFQRKQNGELQKHALSDTIVQVIYDTIYKEKLIHDTIIRTRYKTKTKVNYIDTTPIVLNQKRSFVYIKDTFNIDERTYYLTEKGDTVKAFYFDYTYYIFKYHFKDTLVFVDSVIGCDLYTHCICDDRERIVMFHTCEGESRMIVNMLNKQGK